MSKAMPILPATTLLPSQYPTRQRAWADVRAPGSVKRPGRSVSRLSCEEPMGDAPNRVGADDLTLRTDSRGGGGGGARNVNACEAARLVE